MMNEITLHDLRPLENVATPYWQPPPLLSFVDWQQTGHQLMAAYSNLPWKIGDWVNEGQRRYGEAYAQAIQVTGGTYEMLRKWSYVAAHIQIGTRVPILSWSLHRGVAPLPEYWQKILLISAQALHLDSHRMWTIARGIPGLPAHTQGKLIDRFIATEDPRELIDSLDLLRSASALRPLRQAQGPAGEPVEPRQLPSPIPGHRLYITRIQAASKAIDQARWATTTGARALPIIMKPIEHDDLVVHTNTTADAAAWLLADHAHQIQLEVYRLADLDRWPTVQRETERSRRLIELASASHLTQGQLETARLTAAAFPPDRRRQSETLCYRHHEIVIDLDEPQQDYWLDIAERDNLSPTQLRDEMSTPQEPKE